MRPVLGSSIELKQLCLIYFKKGQLYNTFVYWSDGLGGHAFDHLFYKCPEVGIRGGMLEDGTDSHIYICIVKMIATNYKIIIFLV